MENQISTKILRICKIWLQIWNLGTWITPYSNFLSIYTFFNGVKSLLNLCHLCHLWHKWQRHIFTLAYEQKVALATFKQHLVSKHSILGFVWRDFCVSICVSATCAISGTSGTNLTMTSTPLKKVEMLRKLEYGVIHVPRFQICNQILHILNIFVDIWFSKLN